jgi:hypothetical protein
MDLCVRCSSNSGIFKPMHRTSETHRITPKEEAIMKTSPPFKPGADLET